jgi:hypothetical protein
VFGTDFQERAVESGWRKVARIAPIVDSNEIWIKLATTQPAWFASHPIEYPEIAADP